MKILFIFNDISGSLHYRIVLPAKAFKKQGIMCDISNSDILKHGRIHECLEYDTIVIQRYICKEANEELRYLKQHGKKVFFEIDDYYFEMAPKSKWMESNNNNLLLKDILRYVDGLIVTTEELKDKYSSYNKNVLVFGNYYLQDDMRQFSINKRDDNIVKAIWSGGDNHYIDLYQIKDVVNYLIYKYDNFEFNIMGADFTHIFAKSNRIKFIGTSYRKSIHSKEFEKDIEDIEAGNPSTSVMEYYTLLNDGQFDLGFIPLTRCVHNDCKSNCKLLEYGLFKIPIIASNDLVYSDIKNYTNGFVANNHQDWIKYISMLVEDTSLRNIMTENMYKYVLNTYDIEYHINKYIGFLEK